MNRHRNELREEVVPGLRQAIFAKINGCREVLLSHNCDIFLGFRQPAYKNPCVRNLMDFKNWLAEITIFQMETPIYNMVLQILRIVQLRRFENYLPTWISFPNYSLRWCSYRIFILYDVVDFEILLKLHIIFEFDFKSMKSFARIEPHYLGSTSCFPVSQRLT